MPADYKLRLGDGTILAVDEAGLRTWLIDNRAMVQPAGSRRWIPLKEALAHVQAENKRLESLPRPPLTPPPPPPAPPSPPPQVTAPVASPEPPPPAAPAPAPPPPRAVAPAPPPAPEPASELDLEAAPALALALESFEPSAPAPPVAPAPPAPTPAPPPPPAATAPVAKPPVAKPPVAKPPVAATPAVTPVVTPPPPAPKPAVPKPPAPAAAAAPPPRPIVAAPAKPAASAAPLDLAEVARTAFVAPAPTDDTTPAQTAPPPPAELPVIPFKPLDAEALRERAKATVHQEPDDEEGLEELPLVDPAEDPLLRATRKGQDLLATAAARVRKLVASASASAPPSTATPSAPPAPREPVAPPPASELPVLRFADEKAPVRAPRMGMQTKLLIAGGVAAILVVATGWAWVPPLIEAGRRWASRTEKKEAVPSPSPASPTPPPPTLPPEVQLAVDQLPHLTAETIQIVMKKSAYRPRDPAEVFSRAETAAVRGMSSLPEDEANELSALRLAVARSLRPTDRQRVRGYERIRTGRELLSVSEDVKVLALFARGVRALPPEKRERLQTLLGKAIVAELGPLPSPDGTYSAATPGR